MWARSSAEAPGAGVIETAAARIHRWIARAHAPARLSPRALLEWIQSDRIEAKRDCDRRVLVGATHAALRADRPAPPGIADLGDARPYACRIFSEDRRVPPIRAEIRLVELAPLGIGSLRGAPPFWGCVIADGARLPDLRYSVDVKLREDLAMLRREPTGRLAMGSRRFDLLELWKVSNPAGVACAVRRGRLGCVFEVRGDLWAAIEIEEEGA